MVHWLIDWLANVIEFTMLIFSPKIWKDQTDEHIHLPKVLTAMAHEHLMAPEEFSIDLENDIRQAVPPAVVIPWQILCILIRKHVRQNMPSQVTEIVMQLVETDLRLDDQGWNVNVFWQIFAFHCQEKGEKLIKMKKIWKKHITINLKKREGKKPQEFFIIISNFGITFSLRKIKIKSIRELNMNVFGLLNWRGESRMENDYLDAERASGPMNTHWNTVSSNRSIGRFPCFSPQRAVAVPVPHQIPRFQVWGSNPSQDHFFRFFSLLSTVCNGKSMENIFWITLSIN